MKCPYCGEEMVPGNLAVDHGRYMGAFYWLPEGEKPPNAFLFTEDRVVKKGGFLLTRNDNPFVPAQHCPKCKKLIVDYE